MSSFEEHANTLAGVELVGDYPGVEEALEAGQEALTLAASLATTFGRNGAVMPKEVNVGDIERLFDAHMSELRAAAVLLADFSSDDPKEDAVGRARIIHKELSAAIEAGHNEADPRSAQGFLKLARRVELVREELTRLQEMMKQLTQS